LYFWRIAFRVGSRGVQSALTKLQGLATATREFLRRHWQRALQIREKIRINEEAFHLILAGGVGVMGGLVNLLFYYSTELVRHLALRFPGDPVEVAERLATWQRVLTPTLGGLVAGLVV
jgi:CIC family chloride channel protein